MATLFIPETSVVEFHHVLQALDLQNVGAVTSYWEHDVRGRNNHPHQHLVDCCRSLRPILTSLFSSLLTGQPFAINNEHALNYPLQQGQVIHQQQLVLTPIDLSNLRSTVYDIIDNTYFVGGVFNRKFLILHGGQTFICRIVIRFNHDHTSDIDINATPFAQRPAQYQIPNLVAEFQRLGL